MRARSGQFWPWAVRANFGLGPFGPILALGRSGQFWPWAVRANWPWAVRANWPWAVWSPIRLTHIFVISRLTHICVSLTADPYICHLMADPYICHLTADPCICHLTAGSSLSQQFGPNLAPWGPMPGGVGERQPPHYMGPYWAFKGALLPIDNWFSGQFPLSLTHEFPKSYVWGRMWLLWAMGPIGMIFRAAHIPLSLD